MEGQTFSKSTPDPWVWRKTSGDLIKSTNWGLIVDNILDPKVRAACKVVSQLDRSRAAQCVHRSRHVRHQVPQNFYMRGLWPGLPPRVDLSCSNLTLITIITEREGKSRLRRISLTLCTRSPHSSPHLVHVTWCCHIVAWCWVAAKYLVAGDQELRQVLRHPQVHDLQLSTEVAQNV